MQARSVAAARGWSWIVEGFRLFLKNPVLLTFLVFGYWLMLVSINIVPFVGMIAAPVCLPAFSVSVMEGCRAIERGEQGSFALLFAGFQRNARKLLLLGALYTVASLLVLAITFIIDGGALLEAMTSGKGADAEVIREGRLLTALQVGMVLSVPVIMAFWFSPLLTAWNDVAPVKSVFFSLVASWRNWRPFFVYGAGLALITAVLPGVVLAIAALVSEELLNVAATALSLPLLFIFLPTLFASFYVSYRDVFGEPPAHVPAR